MRTKHALVILLTGLLVTGNATSSGAGGRLESFNITGNVPSPIPGHVVARVIGIGWDSRTLPVRYALNTTQEPVPNPLGAGILTVAQARTALQQSLDQWNDIRTSFIAMRITASTANNGLSGFDMVNELTFRTASNFTAIASSPSTNLIQDTTFVNGDDIDEDGDSDVSSAITTAADVDGDGDIEFPAGFYKAGTILDNDVQFNTKITNGYRFTTGDAALDAVTRSVDLNTVATHEFGHSLGLSHAMTNQTSGSNGDGATMFPFINTGDPEAERLQRTLSTDDIAWASYLYQEGSVASGPGAIQYGDVPFRWLFGTIEGALQHGVLNQPLVGASVYAVGHITKRAVSSGYSGTIQLSFNPATGGLSVLNDPAFTLQDGKYVIPVPLGLYAVGIEAVDGTPVAAGAISLTTQIGSIFGQQNFNEEFYNRAREAVLETRPGEDFPVLVLPGQRRTGISIVTADTFNVNNFGARNFVGFVNPISPGAYYAVAVPAARIAAIAPGEPLAVTSMLFDTIVIDSSTVPLFSEAMLTTGVINGDGAATIDLANPLDRVQRFVGQDNDFSPLFLKKSVRLGQKIRDGVASGEIQNLFMVLRLPTTSPFPGVSGQPPLIGLSTTPPAAASGLSFFSNDGATFTRRTDINFRFSLVLSRLPPP
jgi:hypothetical protein